MILKFLKLFYIIGLKTINIIICIKHIKLFLLYYFMQNQNLEKIQHIEHQLKVQQNQHKDQSSDSSDEVSSFYKVEQGIQKQSEQKNTQKIRYKYCCKKCKHTQRGKKACVCVVPLSQRRTLLGDHGCQTCKCKGCSTEDYISRGQDPEYKPSQKKPSLISKQQQFQARNGCCRRCMKAFSKSNKACLCQVPGNVRKGKLPASGCKLCGCHGCNPEDRKSLQKQIRKRSKSRQRSRSKKRRRRSVSSDNSYTSNNIDQSTLNLNNFDKSIMGNMISDHRVLACILGFGVAQRTQSYIIGKPK